VSVYPTWEPEGRKGFSIRGLTDDASVDSEWNKYASPPRWQKGKFGVVPGTIFKINEPGSTSRSHIKFIEMISSHDIGKNHYSKNRHTKLRFHKGKWDGTTWTPATSHKVRDFKVPHAGWEDPDQLAAYIMAQKPGKWEAVRWFNSKLGPQVDKDTGFRECIGWTTGKKPIVPKGKATVFGAEEYFDFYDYNDYDYEEAYDDDGEFYDDEANFDDMAELGRMEEALLRRLNRIEMMKRKLNRYNYWD